MKLVDSDKLIKLLEKQMLIPNNDYEAGFNWGIGTAIRFISKLTKENEFCDRGERRNNESKRVRRKV